MKEELQMLLAALNTIEVHGRNNVGTLFNCIDHVDKMIADCDKPQDDKEDAKEV